MERPKYLEYRHRRDQITGFRVRRTVVITLERPALALLRLVGKKTSAKRETYDEEWRMELRTSDVRPDYSALVKVQVTDAKKLVKGEEVSYDSGNPTTEFLNETVDQFGRLREHAGTLPTPQLVVFPDEPQITGGEWERERDEMLPISGPDGRTTGHEPMTVVYRGRIDGFGEQHGVQYADISVSAVGRRGEETDPVWQQYTVAGTVKFAVREGHIINADVVRSMAVHLEKHVLTTTTKEEFQHESEGTEQTVGGMRL
jgi:hypothetical protein